MRFNKLNPGLFWLHNSMFFLRQHFGVILFLGLVAAFGRVIQLGGFGSIEAWMNIVLEVVVESARIILFLYVLGLASIKDGALRIKRLFLWKGIDKTQRNAALSKMKRQWRSIVLNFAGFLVIAFVANYMIDLLAYETCLYLKLKQGGVLASTSSEWTIILFFKNLSVIPFTLVFEASKVHLAG